MNVLVACEFSGIVREAFRAKGHNAFSCDILPSEIPGYHIQCDVSQILNKKWDLMIAHPPCTHLAVSGSRWFKHKSPELQKEALRFFKELIDAPIQKIAIENPISVASTFIRKPDQIIHPWMFGERFEKTTCLWLKNLPKLIPTNIVDKGEFHIWIRKSNTPTRINLEGKPMKIPKWTIGKNGYEKSRTFKGIAEAMANQWG